MRGDLLVRGCDAHAGPRGRARCRSSRVPQPAVDQLAGSAGGAGGESRFSNRATEAHGPSLKRPRNRLLPRRRRARRIFTRRAPGPAALGRPETSQYPTPSEHQPPHFVTEKNAAAGPSWLRGVISTTHAQLEHFGQVPLRREHHGSAELVEVDLLDLLQRRADADLQQAREARAGDDWPQCREGVAHGAPRSVQQLVERTVADCLDCVAENAPPGSCRSSRRRACRRPVRIRLDITRALPAMSPVTPPPRSWLGGSACAAAVCLASGPPGGSSPCSSCWRSRCGADEMLRLQRSRFHDDGPDNRPLRGRGPPRGSSPCDLEARGEHVLVGELVTD